MGGPKDIMPKPLTKEEQANVDAKTERILTILRAYWAEHGYPDPITGVWAQSHALYNQLYPGKNSHES